MHKQNYRVSAPVGTPKGFEVTASAVGTSGASKTRLGNITESAAPQTPVSESLEQCQRWSKRRDRYILQAASSLSLGRSHRVSTCQRVPSREVQRLGGNRSITKNEHGTAYFSGVGACGSVWSCPVCSQKISESRRNEALKAMSEHRKSGGYSILVTYTFSHGRHDVLKDMVKSLALALSRMKSWKAYKKLRADVGQTGSIRALEVTHGNSNGWHPHVHEVWFLDKPLSRRAAVDLKNSLYKIWSQCAVKFGLGKPSEKRGVDVKTGQSDDGKSAISYVTKWGYELTYGHTKKARSGRSPWQILSDLAKEWSLRDHKLWVEYSEAFAGRAQLYWSRGLKDQYGINDVSDDEISDAQEKHHVCDMSAEQWSAIVWLKKRAEVLEKAEVSPPAQVIDFINELVRYNQAEYKRVRSYKDRLKSEIEHSTLQHLKTLSL